jgi:hypothetical protein
MFSAKKSMIALAAGVHQATGVKIMSEHEDQGLEIALDGTAMEVEVEVVFSTKKTTPCYFFRWVLGPVPVYRSRIVF